MKSYTLRPEILILFLFILLVPLFMIGLAVNKILDNFSVLEDISFLAFFAVALFVAWLYFYISIGYLSEDLEKTVLIDNENHEIIITKDRKELRFQTNEIIKCYYVKGYENFRRSIFYGHKYLVFILKDYSRVFITNLIADPDDLIRELSLTVKTIETYIPNVDKGIGNAIYNKEEYDTKVKEFYSSFSGKSITELTTICKRSNIYSKYAIIAAKQLIKEKNTCK
jgi:hypothetical protein